jgi:hypothetical protein
MWYWEYISITFKCNVVICIAFNIKMFCSHRVHLCISYLSNNKQQLSTYTVLLSLTLYVSFEVGTGCLNIIYMNFQGLESLVNGIYMFQVKKKAFNWIIIFLLTVLANLYANY